MTRKRTLLIVICSIIVGLIIYAVSYQLLKNNNGTVYTYYYTVEFARNGNTSSIISPLSDGDELHYLIKTTKKKLFGLLSSTYEQQVINDRNNTISLSYVTLPSDPPRTIVVGVVNDENIKLLNYVDPHGAIGIIESIDFQANKKVININELTHYPHLFVLDGTFLKGTLFGADASGRLITEYPIELNDEAIDGGGS